MIETITMSKLFSGNKHAQLNANFRPRYPQSLRDAIFKYLRSGGGGWQLAVDVGCGNGQGTLELAADFDRVIGSDVSEAQIAATPTHQPKVSVNSHSNASHL